ncbi:conserved virulence factor C family protein [Lederbergia citrea]|uniref:Conserved virulence factor C family protein n=1 Tax=Lederbergia citrea TaxID=2833581 RepID=A0A942UNV0_9BACI|nr:conserved virulence factor C family protein [Lederbergia citrea]MBS4222138.1 conserved virulence factor C family protein [Lederbergia citrea]
MNIKTIEPTPSPNTMKIILDEELPAGRSNNYKNDQADEAPPIIKTILQIEGVKGIYHVADFLAVERNGKYSWEEILPKVREAFGEDAETMTTTENEQPDEHFGEVNVQIQMFKDIPLQVKLTTGNEEKRFGLPERFQEAMEAAQLESDNYILLRKWKDMGARYGDLEVLGNEIIEELGAAYPKERLVSLVERAHKPQSEVNKTRKQLLILTPDMLEDPDWKKRYQLLEQMDNPTLEDLPVLEKALTDDKMSIRRLAVVYLGMIEDERVLPFLYKGLHDKVVTVRRTAGDCLSDLGFPEAMSEMSESLKDKSKIVRWRAAMFLYEVGDASVLPALKAAANDPEFEVQLQIKMAIERIEGGEEAKGSVWKQMTEARQKDKV